PAAIVQEVQQTKWACATVAQHQLRYFRTQLRIVGLKRSGVDTIFEHGSTEYSRIDEGLTGAIGTSGVHYVCGISQQRNITLNPGRNGIAVDHGILKNFSSAAQHTRDVDPVIGPVLEMMHEIFMPYLFVPVAIGPARGIVYRDLCNPIDVGKTGERIRSGNGIKHHAMTVSTKPHKGRAGADRPALSDAAPHDRASPLNGRLVRIHLTAHCRMQAIGRNQQGSLNLGTMTVAASQ